MGFRFRKRIRRFKGVWINLAKKGSSLPSPITFYGPNPRFNGKPVTHEFLQNQFDNSSRIFPQRSSEIISGPTVSPAQDSPGATVNYEISGVLSNGLMGLHVKGSVQLTVAKRGDQFEIVAIWPRVSEHHPL